MAVYSFHCLLVTFQALWKHEVDEFPVVVPARTFYDGSVHYYNIDRLGGVLSHLNRTLKVDLMQVLGLDHPVITAMELPGSLTQDLGKLLTAEMYTFSSRFCTNQLEPKLS
jgi:hypothetical protein